MKSKLMGLILLAGTLFASTTTNTMGEPLDCCSFTFVCDKVGTSNLAVCDPVANTINATFQHYDIGQSMMTITYDGFNGTLGILVELMFDIQPTMVFSTNIISNHGVWLENINMLPNSVNFYVNGLYGPGIITEFTGTPNCPTPEPNYGAIIGVLGGLILRRGNLKRMWQG